MCDKKPKDTHIISDAQVYDSVMADVMKEVTENKQKMINISRRIPDIKSNDEAEIVEK